MCARLARTANACRRSAQPNGVMTCGEKNKTADVWFRLEAVDGAPSSLAAPSAGKAKDEPTVAVEAHLLHVASGRYCAVDGEDFSLPLTCDFDGRPKVLIKVRRHTGWLRGCHDRAQVLDGAEKSGWLAAAQVAKAAWPW